MRTPSRRMPPLPQASVVDSVVVSIGCLSIVVILLVFFTHVWPLTPLVFAVLLLWIAAGVVTDRWRCRALAASRRGESICTFARSFDCRAVDTWIIRATYEELQARQRLPFPIQIWDSLESDFGLDPDAVNDLADAIATRARRSLEDGERNPWYDRVHSVRSLVLFLNHQPRLAAD